VKPVSVAADKHDNDTDDDDKCSYVDRCYSYVET